MNTFCRAALVALFFLPFAWVRHENAKAAAAAAAAVTTPAWRVPAPMAEGVDYSLEAGLPVEWREDTIHK